MTHEENEIMRDAFFFLRDHIDPPAKGTPASKVFWDRAAQEISELGAKWNNHPLALEVLPAIYSYIETKSNPSVAEKIARCMEMACKNSKIGYDQDSRNTLYKEAEPFGFDVSKVSKPCETDCSALVRVCIAYAGITSLPSGFRTGNMPRNLAKTGAFTELTGSKYQSQSTYLGRGDILVTKTSGHTVVVLSNGSKYEGLIQPVEYELGDRVIKYGCEGNDVKLMQEMLMKLGYSLGSWGCDGDFGDCTDLAQRAFQRSVKLKDNGECDATTLKALLKAVDASQSTGCDDDSGPINVRIVGGSCYIRNAPNTDGKKLGVAHNGDTLPFGGEISDGGWPQVKYQGQDAWVSGKYSQIE